MEVVNWKNATPEKRLFAMREMSRGSNNIVLEHVKASKRFADSGVTPAHAELIVSAISGAIERCVVEAHPQMLLSVVQSYVNVVIGLMANAGELAATVKTEAAKATSQ